MRNATRQFGLAAAAAAAVLLIGTDRAQAQVQVKPFKIAGWGVAPFGLPLPGQGARPHTIIAGHATHLGEHHGLGTVETDTAVPHADGTITGQFGSGGTFVFTGEHGEVLVCNYGRTAFGASTPGTFTLVPFGRPGVYVAFFVAEFVPVGAECTGKFAGVSGGWTMYAVTAPFRLGYEDPTPYSWEGEGSLNFRK